MRSMLLAALLLTAPMACHGAEWYHGVVHLHTSYSDGGYVPAKLVEVLKARPERLRFAILTDHYDQIDSSDKQATPYSEMLPRLVGPASSDCEPRTGFGSYDNEAAKLTHDGEFVVIAGVEIGTRWKPGDNTEASSHTLALGVLTELDSQPMDGYYDEMDGQQDVISMIRYWGMLPVAAHPSMTRRNEKPIRLDYRFDKRPSGQGHEVKYKGLAGVELMNSLSAEQFEEDLGFYLRLIREAYRPFVTAGSDYHYPLSGDDPLGRITGVYADALTADGLLKAMADGRTYAAQHGARLVSMSPMPGEHVRADAVTIRARVEFPKPTGSPKTFTVYRDGIEAPGSRQTKPGAVAAYDYEWADPEASGTVHAYVLRVGEVLVTSPAYAAMAPRTDPQVASDLSTPGTAAGQEVIGPDDGTYVWVPAGEFMMGSEDWGDERPVHRVRLTEGFWLSKCEVTNAQYRRFCEATGREFPSDSDQGPDHPVGCVSWEDATAYCDHYGLRLPTEAQWEYAARGPRAREYPWGDDWDATRCCNRENTGPGDRTYPVGSFPTGASWCGAQDLAGNVWEWCGDWYDGEYYRGSPEEDPEGAQQGQHRVARGGGFDPGAICCRSAGRFRDVPTFRYRSLGLRPVAVPR